MLYYKSADEIATELVVAHRVRREVAALATPPRLTAALDALLEITPRRTEPAFAEIAACEELVFARAESRPTFEYYVGHRDVLAAKLRDIANYLELGRAERAFLLTRLYAIPPASAGD
jgi:hypothetical protein